MCGWGWVGRRGEREMPVVTQTANGAEWVAAPDPLSLLSWEMRGKLLWAFWPLPVVEGGGGL